MIPVHPYSSFIPPTQQEHKANCIPAADLDVLTDHHSPIFACSSKVKQLFRRDQLTGTITVHLTNLESIINDQTSVCGRALRPNILYPLCRTCSDSQSRQIHFCEQCWQPNQHFEHLVEFEEVVNGKCCCGCPQIYSCLYHLKSIEINKQDRLTHNLQLLRQIFDIMLYILHNPTNIQNSQSLTSNIFREIAEFAKSNSLYSSAVLEMTQTVLPSKFIPNYTYLNYLLIQECELLQLDLFNDNKTIQMISISVIQLQECGCVPQKMLNFIQKLFGTHPQVILTLSQSGLFFNNMKMVYFKHSMSSEEGSKVLMKYFHYVQKNTHIIMPYFIIELCEQLTDLACLCRMTKQVQIFILKQLVSSYKKGEISVTQQHGDPISSRWVIISHMISYLCREDPRKLLSYEASRTLLGIDETISTNLDCYLEDSVRYLHFLVKQAEILDWQKRPLALWPVFLSLGHPQKDYFISVLLNGLSFQPLKQKNKFLSFITNLLQMVLELIESVEKDCFSNQVRLKMFLFERQEIRYSQIEARRSTGDFDFKGSAEIMHEHCRYVSQTQIFKYKSVQKYPHYAERLKILLGSLHSAKYHPIKYREGRVNIFQDQVDGYRQQELIQFFITEIFTHQDLITIFKEQWSRIKQFKEHKRIKHHSCFYRQLNEGTVFILSMIIALECSQHRNMQLRSFLQNFRQNEQMFNMLAASIDGSIESLVQILNVCEVAESDLQIKQLSAKQVQSNHQNTNEMPPTNGSQNEQKNIPEPSTSQLQRFKKKKEKMHKFFNQKRQKFLSGVEEHNPQQSNGLNNKNQSESICIICHQGTNEHKLAYFMAYFRKLTISNILFSDKVLLRDSVQVKHCMHLIHPQCYWAEKKESHQFECPLCSHRSNCLLPDTGADEDLIRKCENLLVILSASAYDSLDFHSLLEEIILCLISRFFNLFLSYLLNCQPGKISNYNLLRIAEELANSSNQSVRINSSIESIKQRLRPSESRESNQNERQSHCYRLNNIKHFVIQMFCSRIKHRAILWDEQLTKQFADICFCLQLEEFEKLKVSMQEMLCQEISFPQLPECLQASMRGVGKSMLIYKNLPRDNVKLKKTAQQSQCCYCGENSMNQLKWCILCDKIICKQSSCFNRHNKLHQRVNVYLSFNDGQIEVNDTMKGSLQFSVYFDGFHSAYKQMSKYGYPGIYRLQEDDLDDLNQYFVSIMLED